MRKIAMPVPFDDRTIKILTYNEPERDNNSFIRDDEDRQPAIGSTNQHTWDFMKKRYTVIRGIVPQDIIDITIDNWKAAERTPGYLESMHREENDITFKNPKSSIGKSDGGYCTPWGIALHQYVWKQLEHYIDLPLRQTYSYSRKYDRGAYLASHVDRPSCEVSATLCLEYKTDDQRPWPIWIRGDNNYAGWQGDEVQAITQKIPNRQRESNNCTQVMLEPGDLLLYQGPNAPHWRDYLLGDYSYHIFLHFYNLRTEMCRLDNFWMDDNETAKDSDGKILKKLEKPAAYKMSNLELDGRVDRFDNKNDPATPGFLRFVKAWDDIKMLDEHKEAYRDLVNNYDNIVNADK